MNETSPVRTERSNGNDDTTFREFLKKAGPGAVVAAGIIGPGTVTTISVAGGEYGYAALWIVILAVVLSYIYQEPAIRLTAATGMTLVEAVRKLLSPLLAKFMFVAAFLGALAFQAGNFVGAGLAMNFFVPNMPFVVWAAICAAISLLIVSIGVFRLFEHVLTAAVVLMVFAFVITALFSQPNFGEMVGTGLSFSTLDGNWMLVGGIIATTFPPNIAMAYSTYLKKKILVSGDSVRKTVKLSRYDLRLNVVLLALICLGILIAAASVIFPTGVTVESADQMAVQLTPLVGQYAGVLFSLGLFAAGISSGLYQATLQPAFFAEAFGRDENPKTLVNRAIAAITLVIPIVFLLIMGGAPVELIITAQAINALILPLIAVIMLVLTSKNSIMGVYSNSWWQTLRFIVLTVVVVLLGIRVFIGFF